MFASKKKKKEHFANKQIEKWKIKYTKRADQLNLK